MPLDKKYIQYSQLAPISSPSLFGVNGVKHQTMSKSNSTTSAKAYLLALRHLKVKVEEGVYSKYFLNNLKLFDCAYIL